VKHVRPRTPARAFEQIGTTRQAGMMKSERSHLSHASGSHKAELLERDSVTNARPSTTSWRICPRHPEPINLTVPKATQSETKVRHADGSEEDLPTRPMHLMAAADGTVPITLNEWERKVLDSEAAQPGFKGWYRNPGRAAKESLAVAYKDEVGDWKALRPDFIFFGTSHDGQIVVDPHGHHLSDALPKLRGLADFVERFVHDFRRVESVAETGGTLRVLDLTKANVREAIRDAQSAKALYESEHASDY
jgi:type III restriction enzyme